MQPLNVAKNDYFVNRKSSDIQTPNGVCQFLFDLVKNHLPKTAVILDPALGEGNLLKPFRDADFSTIGVDIYPENKKHCDWFHHAAFEDIWDWPPSDIPDIPIDLIICNPPFNGARGRQLYSEVFLRRMIRWFGSQQEIILFTPMGFRLNQRKKSKRWKWLRDTIEISSIISLPLDVFGQGVEFHTEILCFNLYDLNSHYFLPEECCEFC